MATTNYPPPDATRAEIEAWERAGVTVTTAEDAPLEAQLDLLAWLHETDRAGALAMVRERMKEKG